MKFIPFVLLILILNAPAAKKPNILLIIADDLGYNDVSFTADQNAAIQTPAIDRIANEGVKLNRFYACPVCSPTRVGTMTGRWPHTLGLMRAVIPPWRKRGLEPKLMTLPKILAKNGYNRRAIIGKWHLGHSQEAHLPLNQGFTHFYGHLNGAIDYFTPGREGENDWHRNNQPVFEEGYATDLLAKETVNYIEESHKKNEPFFIYLPFNAPHSPFQAKEEDIAEFPNLTGNRQIYAAMVKAMDDGIETILNKLDELKIADNTFVLFYSDNGGVNKVKSKTEIRDGKFSVYEGGIRVCAAARWPKGNISGGLEINSSPIGYIDVLPTICQVAGIELEKIKYSIDGENILSVLQGQSKGPERSWFSYIHQSPSKEHYSLIYGDFKLVKLINHKGNKSTQKVELYNLQKCSTEQKDLASQYPEKVEGMLKKLAEIKQKQQNPINHYSHGRSGYKAPKNWIIKDK